MSNGSKKQATAIAVAICCLVIASTSWSVEQVLDQKIRGADVGFNSDFGQSIAMDDDVIVIGSPAMFTTVDAEGAAYVFVPPSGGWETLPPHPQETFHTVKLVASEPSREDKMGNAVAIDGDVIAVGASSKVDTDSGLNNSGVVYVYVEPAGGWASAAGIVPLTESAVLRLSNPGFEEFFGHQVVIVGDEIVVSAPGYEADDDTADRGGAVFVFTKPAGGWTGTITPTATLRGQVVLDFDRIGFSLAFDGQTVVAGARADPQRTPLIYLYERPPTGWGSLVYTEDYQLRGSTGTDNNSLDNDAFGSGLAVQGGLIAAGAVTYRDPLDPGSGNVGIVQVFQRPVAGWSNIDANLPVASLRNSDRITNGAFGASIAMDGDQILVGRGTSFSSGDDDFGSAYLFQQPADGWSGQLFENLKLTAIDPASRADFGEAVTLEDNTLAITAGYKGVRARGRAYLGNVSELPIFSNGFEALP